MLYYANPHAFTPRTSPYTKTEIREGKHLLETAEIHKEITMSQQRRIKLQKQEYSFPFNNPSGARVKCTVIDGAGTVTLYEE